MKKSFTKLSDEELVKILKTGRKKNSDKAFTELYNRYEKKVYSYCVYVLGGEEAAADIFQETFVRFYKKINAGYANTNVPAYLLTIARNLCYNFKRDQKTTVPVEFANLACDNQPNYENRELYELVLSAADMLEPIYREAFVLRELEGLAYSQIAEICGLSLTGAQSRVVRAKEKIIKILQPYLKELEKTL